MPVQTREYLKSRFESGDTPTAQDFIDLIDSALHVDDDILAWEDEILFYEDEILTSD